MLPSLNVQNIIKNSQNGGAVGFTKRYKHTRNL